MRVYRLGIVGGCLSHQAGIPFSRLYHQVLSRQLRDAYGVTLRPVIDRSFGSPLDERLAALANRQADLVLMHVRSVVTVAATRVYRRKPRARSNRGPEPSADQQPAVGSRAGLHPDWVHEGNMALGVLLGRHRRVSSGQVREAVMASEVGAKRGVVLLVMGPTGVLRGPVDRLVCAKLNQSLARASHTEGFEFVDLLGEWDRAFCLPDGYHLTAEGHRHVADRLFAAISPRVALTGADGGLG